MASSSQQPNAETQTDGSVPLFVADFAGKRIGIGQKQSTRRFSFGVGATARITEFSFDENEKKSIEVLMDMTFTSYDDLETMVPRKGDIVTIRWGYLGQLSEKHEMRVHSVEPSYDKDIKVKVVARDESDGLRHYPMHKVWENTPLAKVIKDLASSLGKDGCTTVILPGAVAGQVGGDSFTTSESSQNPTYVTRGGAQPPKSPVEEALLNEKVNLSMQGRTPMGMMRHIAHRVGCDVQVTGNTIKFLPEPIAAAPTFVFTYRSSGSVLQSFHVKVKDSAKNGGPARGTESAGVDKAKKVAFKDLVKDATKKGDPKLGVNIPCGQEAGDPSSFRSSATQDAPTSSSADDRLPVLKTDSGPEWLDYYDPGPHGSSRIGYEWAGAHLATPSGKPSDSKRNASSVFSESQRGGVTATATILGIPTIRRRHIIEIRGVAQHDCGKWMVTSCVHKIGASGYTVTLQLKRHGQGGKKNTAGRKNDSKPADSEKATVQVALISQTNASNVGVINKRAP